MEVRGSEGEAFTASHYEETTLNTFLERWSAGDPLVYLTTEAMHLDQQGRLATLSPPVSNPHLVSYLEVYVYLEIISAGRHDGRSVNSQHRKLAGKLRGK